jgi:hypothetical protein
MLDASHPCGKLVRFVGNRAAGAPWDMQKIIAQSAQEIRVEQRQVLAAAKLLDGGDGALHRPLPQISDVSALQGQVLPFFGTLTCSQLDRV